MDYKKRGSKEPRDGESGFVTFAIFVQFGEVIHCSMAAPNRKSLPPEVRTRIEKLETAVSELAGALDLLVSEMRRQGLAPEIPVGEVNSLLLKSIFRQGKAKVTKKPAAAATGLAAAVARGEAARVEWVRSGEVVPASVLAEKWGLTPQALGPAADRGEVFAIVVKRRRYYPKEFLELCREDVAAVSQSLGNLSPEEKLVFWKHAHGALGGKTVLQLLSRKNRASQLTRVTELARARAAQQAKPPAIA